MASTLTAAPPPPPPAAPQKAPPATKLPAVPPNGPKGAFLVELLMWNGFPFKDHWAFWVCSATHPKLGIQIHADGDVLHGFEFQIKRSQDFRVAGDIPTRRIPLQWVDGVYFDEKAMFNGGVLKVDNVPVCGFEESASKVKVPGKSLNAVKDQVNLIDLTSAVSCF